MVAGAEGERSLEVSCAVSSLQLGFTSQLEDRKGIGVDAEKLDSPRAWSEIAVGYARIILEDQLGGIQEEIAGFGKSIERQEVGGCLQVGGT